ncbi:MAG: hypothetical protein K8R86_00885 [Bacteroidales bacterium]|nr:hypothetical protein [Bacteroidales bacterium]
MKKIYTKFSFGLLLFVLLTTTTNAQIQPTGSGTGADPYQIATIDNLLWVSTN